MSLSYSSALVLASSLALALACSASPTDPSPLVRGSQTAGGSPGDIVTGNGGSGNSLNVNNAGATAADPTDKRDIPMR